MSFMFANILIYEIFIYCDSHWMIEHTNTFLKQIIGFYGNTGSNFPCMWTCWIIKKNLSLIHLNKEKHLVTILTVNPQELTPSAVSEWKNQIIKFFMFLIRGYENIEIKIANFLIRYSMLIAWYAQVITRWNYFSTWCKMMDFPVPTFIKIWGKLNVINIVLVAWH